MGLLGAFRRMPILLADLLNMIVHRALIARARGLIRKPAGILAVPPIALREPNSPAQNWEALL